MSRKLKKATKSWLRAERRATGGADVDAERALVRVFGALPMPMPSSALASRTMAQLGLSPLASRSSSGVPKRPHWAYRWAVTLALALSGLATTVYAPVLMSSLSLKGSANWLVDVSAGFLAAVFRRLATGYTLWDVIARAGSTAAEVMATPQVLGLAFAILLFGLATFRVLAGVVAVERSSYHA